MVSEKKPNTGYCINMDESTQLYIIHTMGQLAIDLFRSFVFATPADKDKIEPVLIKFEKFLTKC